MIIYHHTYNHTMPWDEQAFGTFTGNYLARSLRLTPCCLRWRAGVFFVMRSVPPILSQCSKLCACVAPDTKQSYLISSQGRREVATMFSCSATSRAAASTLGSTLLHWAQIFFVDYAHLARALSQAVLRGRIAV